LATFAVICAGGGVYNQPLTRPSAITAVIGTVAAKPANPPRIIHSIALASLIHIF
jgi:hypothetical protein